MPHTFTIPGKPFAKQRHRFSRKTGRTYTPKETVAFEARVAKCGAEVIDAPIAGPVKLTVLASFEPPKSWLKKKRQEYLGEYHTQRPDADNICKAVKDGLNEIAYWDDCQVAEEFTRKVWGPVSHTVVIVEPLCLPIVGDAE